MACVLIITLAELVVRVLNVIVTVLLIALRTLAIYLNFCIDRLLNGIFTKVDLLPVIIIRHETTFSRFRLLIYCATYCIVTISELLFLGEHLVAAHYICVRKATVF